MPNAPLFARPIERAALAFRGYNTENLGRTVELLAEPRYRAIVTERLREASAICSDVLGRQVDLEARVRSGKEATLAEYAESVALVFASELAQLDLLEKVHGVSVRNARLAFGYSLGELVALVAAGVLDADEVLRVPLAMAEDCAALAGDVTMGVLFSRGGAIDEHSVHEACEEITVAGDGMLAVSAVLSPNTYLVLGQQETVRRLRRELKERFSQRVHLRLNESRWPPLHTPIVRQRYIPDRAAVMMQTMTIRKEAVPPIFSLVTGEMLKPDTPIRQALRDWVDHPQRLWQGVTETLAAGVETVIHIGPAPNVIPATFRRLADNVRQQTTGGNLAAWGCIATRQAQRTWLSSLLPKSAALLRAPEVHQIVLEDWLLENA